MARARARRRAPWPLRLLWRLLAGAGVAVVVVLLAVLALLLSPPAELLRRAALPIVRRALRHERLELGALSLTLRPRGEVELRDLWLGPPAGYDRPLLTARRIVLRYDATGIFGGELRVRQLQVERPLLRVEARRGKLNWLAFLEGLPRATPTPDEKSARPDLRVWVDRVSVIGLGALVDDGQRRLAVDSLHLGLAGLYSRARSHFDVALRLEAPARDQASVTLLQRGAQPLGARLRTTLGLDVAVDDVERPRGSAALSLELASDELRAPWPIAPIRVVTRLRATGDVPRDRAELQQLTVDLDGDELVRLSASLDGLGAPRRAALRLARLHLPLTKLARYARAVVPGIDLGGEVELRDLHLDAPVAVLRRRQLPPILDGTLELRQVRARLGRPLRAQVAGLDGVIAFAARRSTQTLLEEPREILRALSALAAPAAATRLSSRERAPSLAVEGRLRVGLARVAGAEVRGAELRLAAGSALRALQPGAFGAAIALTLPVRYHHPRLGPLRAELRAALRAAGDLERRDLAVERLDVAVDDLLQARLAATAQDFGARSFTADLELQPLDLARALRRLPPALRAAVGEVALAGSLGLHLKARGRLPASPRQLPLAVDARVRLDKVSLRDARLGVAVSGLDGEVALHGRPADLRLSTRLHVAAAGTASEPTTTVDLSAALPLSFPPGRTPRLVAGRPAALELLLRPIPLPLLRRFVAGLPPVEGVAAVEVRLDGSIDDPRLKALVRLERGRGDRLSGLVGSVRLAADASATRLDADLGWERQPPLRLRTRLALGLRRLLEQAGDLVRLGAAPLDVRLDLPRADLAALTKLAPKSPAPAPTGAASVALRVQGTMLQPRVDLRLGLKGARLGSIRLRELESRLGVDVGRGQTRTSLEVSLDHQPLLRARARAAFDLEQLLRTRAVPLATIELTAAAPPLALRRLGDIDRRLARIDGTLSAAIAVAGTTRLPTATVGLTVTKVRHGQIQVGDLRLDASLAGVKPRLEAKLRLRRPDGGLLDGQVELPLRGGPLSARLLGKSLGLAFLSRIDPSLQEVAGTLDLDLRASGSLAQPTLRGTLRLQRGALQLRGLSRLSQLNLQLKLGGRRVELTELSGRSGDGRVSVKGGVELRPLHAGVDPADLLGGFALKIDAKRFRIDAGAVSNAVFTGRVAVEGGLRDRRLVARVSLEEASLRVPSLKGQRKLHSTARLDDVVFVDDRPRATSAGGTPTAPIGLDVALAFDPLFVRGEEVDLEVASDLRARTDRRGRIRLSGRVEIRRGTVRLLGNPFEIRQAILLFSGEPDPDPGLQIQLSRRTAQAVLSIGLQGTLSAPELDLSSDPPIYDRGQIISLILTGRADVRQTSADGDQSLAVAGAVAQVLLGGLARALAPKIGIDVARVSLSESKDKQTGASSVRAEAEVGRYITQRLYLGYRRVFGASADENSNEGLLEYSISAKWLLTAIFGDAGVGGIDIFWSHRY
jgi:hypothetical protein